MFGNGGGGSKNKKILYYISCFGEYDFFVGGSVLKKKYTHRPPPFSTQSIGKKNMSSEDMLRTQITQNQITPQTPIEKLKYIGPYLNGRLQAYGLHTVSDLIRDAAGRSSARGIEEHLTEIMRNQHANECVGRGDDRYHIRDVNWAGYNTLINILRAAREEWPDRPRRRGVPHFVHAARLPREHVVRDRQTAHCGCLRDAETCQETRNCRWVMRQSDGESLCVPTTQHPGFEGAGGYAGQKTKRHLPNPPQSQYVAGWRKPT